MSRAKRQLIDSSRADYVFIGLATAIILFGLLVLSSAASAIGLDRFGDSYFYIKRQIIYGLIPGMILFFIMSKIDYTVWKKYAIPIFVIAIILLVLVFIPGIGSAHNTFSRSWLALGGFSFQPVEAAKLALIIYLAAVLSSMGESIRENSQGFVSVVAIVMIPAFLTFLQPDTGGMFLLVALSVLLLFFARAKIMHLLVVSLFGILALGLMIFATDYRADRFTTFLHPELDPQGKGYHINQAFLAVGSGGWFGLGLGHSRQKFQYLPEVHADSIFAIIAEELGFVVVMVFLFIYALFLRQGFLIGLSLTDEFGRLVAFGIMSWFALQSILNIGGILGLLPMTGVPLPFVSHGGTALMIGMMCLGIMVNISTHANVDSKLRRSSYTHRG